MAIARALALAVLLGLVPFVQATSDGEAAGEAPRLEVFIEAVRGYDVATIRRTFPAYNQGLFALLFGAEGARLSAGARDRITREVACFARAYARLRGSGVTDEAIEADVPFFAGRFVAFVEAGLAIEP